jgi:hypothetical protein
VVRIEIYFEIQKEAANPILANQKMGAGISCELHREFFSTFVQAVWKTF